MRLTGKLALAAAGLAALVTAGPAATEEPTRGGTFVIISSQVPRHFNPAVQSGTATAVPGAQIFATPLRFDEEWNPHPYLAEGLERVGRRAVHDPQPPRPTRVSTTASR